MSSDNSFAYDPTEFSPEVIAEMENQEKNGGFHEVILSYATKSNGGKGKDDMWSIANVLRKNGISSFNGYMVQIGEDWQEEWYGNLPQAKIAILIMSPEYFDSKPCREECIALVKLKGKVVPLPLQFGMPKMGGNFLGSEKAQIKMANLVKQRINNHLPPPDKGPFDKNFEANAKILVAKVLQILQEKGISINPPPARTSSEHESSSVFNMAKVAETLSTPSFDVNDEHVEKAKAELAKGQDPTKLLWKAAEEGRHHAILYLLQNGAEIDKGDPGNFDRTALIKSSDKGHLEAVKALAAAGASLEKGLDGFTSLYQASFNGHLPVVQFLASKGADLNKANNNGCAPLYVASEKGHLPVVQFLASKGADLNKANNKGETPLMNASSNGRLEVVRWFIGQGADRHLKSNDGHAALAFAKTEEIKALLR